MRHRVLVVGLVGACSFLGGCAPESKVATVGSKSYVDPGPPVGALGPKYAGQLVFHRKPMPLESNDDSSVTTTYTLGEGPLFGRFYSKDSPHNLQPECRTPEVDVSFQLSGQDAATGSAVRMEPLGLFRFQDPKHQVASSLTGDTNVAITQPFDSSTKTEVQKTFQQVLVPRLKEGTNTVVFVATVRCSGGAAGDPVIARGALTVVVPPGAKAAFLANSPDLSESPNPDNAKLVPAMLAIMQALPDWQNDDILGARVTAKNWEPVRHPTNGRLIAREIAAIVVTHPKKSPDAEACKKFNVFFSRDVAGGSLQFSGVRGNEPIPCSKAPK